MDRKRLVKLLGMLGSDYDGEVIQAARQADRLVRKSDATWEDVVHPAPAPVTQPPPPPRTKNEMNLVWLIGGFPAWGLLLYGLVVSLYRWVV